MKARPHKSLDVNVHGSIIHNSQKAERIQSRKNPSANEWMHKTWYIHTIGYCSTIKRNQVLTHATTWMNLKGIPLC